MVSPLKQNSGNRAAELLGQCARGVLKRGALRVAREREARGSAAGWCQFEIMK